jgi:hypothetical protein
MAASLAVRLGRKKVAQMADRKVLPMAAQSADRWERSMVDQTAGQSAARKVE